GLPVPLQPRTSEQGQSQGPTRGRWTGPHRTPRRVGSDRAGTGGRPVPRRGLVPRFVAPARVGKRAGTGWIARDHAAAPPRFAPLAPPVADDGSFRVPDATPFDAAAT